MPTTLPYGAWPSPITAELITGRQVGLASPWLDGGMPTGARAGRSRRGGPP